MAIASNGSTHKDLASGSRFPFLRGNDAQTQEAKNEKSLSPVEKEWKQRIYERLLEVMDLSLIATIPEQQAREQISEIASRLMNEASATLSIEQRQRVTKTIEDEVMGLGPLEPLLSEEAFFLRPIRRIAFSISNCIRKLGSRAAMLGSSAFV